MKRAAFIALASGLLGSALAQAQTLPASPSVSESKATSAATAPVTGCCMDMPCCNPCQPGQRFWVSADYLLWWIKNGPIGVPLVTSGDPADSVPGALGQPGTRVLFGNNNVDYGTFSGMRLAAGVRIADGLSLEVGYFLLESRANRFGLASDAAGNPLFGHPAFIVNNSLGLAGEAFYPVANSAVALGGPFSGSTSIVSRTRLQGWEVAAAWNGVQQRCMKLDVLVGARFLDLNESLSIDDSIQALSSGTALSFNGFSGPGSVPATNGAVLSVSDQFRTTNHFYGGQLGLRGEWQRGPWSLAVAGKVALGDTEQLVRINGTSSITPAGGGTTVATGGLFAQQSNIGGYSRNVFGVVPEAQVNLGLDVNSHLKLKVGYSFLYWNDVVRPGRQIDRTINPGQVPLDGDFGATGGPNRPAFNFRGSDFWAQGINFGMEVRY